MKDFGSVKCQHGELFLIQQPYIDGTDKCPIYVAHAVDGNQNEFRIEWDCIDIDCDDESDACNWEHFMVRRIS